jgi:hypothetical protein
MQKRRFHSQNAGFEMSAPVDIGVKIKNLFPLQKSIPAYRIPHHTLIKHREMMTSIS